MNDAPVLLVNLGSPAAPREPEVRRYLDEFLMDPCVIDLPEPLRVAIVRGIILRTRPARSAEAYAKIWTEQGSPLIVISERIRAALERQSSRPVGLAMRYGEPSIPAALDALAARCGGLRDLTVVPLYPQFAMASTQTVHLAVQVALTQRERKGDQRVDVRFVAPFYDDPAYIEALTDSVRRNLPSDCDYLLFSYHGLPKRHLRKSDPTRKHCLKNAECCSTPSRAHATCYRHQVIATTESVAERLGLFASQYGMAFQSRLGWGWLRPFTDRELDAFPSRGIKRLAVVCPAFVADCLETLEEIDIRGRERFLSAGGTGFTYIPCLNDDPAFIAALAGLITTPPSAAAT